MVHSFRSTGFPSLATLRADSNACAAWRFA